MENPMPNVVDEEEANRIAQEYLDSHPLDHPYYEWELREGTELSDAWLFPFYARCVKKIPPEQRESFTGVPGFTVSKSDGAVSEISWSQYQALESKEHRE